MASKKTTDTYKGTLARLTTGAFTGAKRDSLAGFKASSALSFGKPSSSQALNPTTSSNSSLGSLAKSAASGNGLSSLLGGGLANFTGIGSIISGISHLFGGGSSQKSVPALQLFQLPEAAHQTVHANSGSSSPAGSPSINVHVQALDSQSFMTKSNDIAKAVKSAMLNSHSLNDVVSEL